MGRKRVAALSLKSPACWRASGGLRRGGGGRALPAPSVGPKASQRSVVVYISFTRELVAGDFYLWNLSKWMSIDPTGQQSLNQGRLALVLALVSYEKLDKPRKVKHQAHLRLGRHLFPLKRRRTFLKLKSHHGKVEN